MSSISKNGQISAQAPLLSESTSTAIPKRRAQALRGTQLDRHIGFNRRNTLRKHSVEMPPTVPLILMTSEMPSYRSGWSEAGSAYSNEQDEFR